MRKIERKVRQMAKIELTAEQVSNLSFYLGISGSYRKDEIEACKRFSEEIDEDGKPKYPNMRGSVEWWEKTNRDIEDIKTILDDYFGVKAKAELSK